MAIHSSYALHIQKKTEPDVCTHSLQLKALQIWKDSQLTPPPAGRQSTWMESAMVVAEHPHPASSPSGAEPRAQSRSYSDEENHLFRSPGFSSNHSSRCVPDPILLLWNGKLVRFFCVVKSFCDSCEMDVLHNKCNNIPMKLKSFDNFHISLAEAEA